MLKIKGKDEINVEEYSKENISLSYQWQTGDGVKFISVSLLFPQEEQERLNGGKYRFFSQTNA